MRPLDIFFAVLVAAIWGGNFVAAKFGTDFFPPFLLTALRFSLVSLVLIPLVPRPPAALMRPIVALASMSALHFSLIFVAIDRGLDIASGALIGQLGVPFACIMGAIFLKDRIGPWRIGGIAVAFLGVAIVTGAPNILSHLPAFYAILGSAFTWGVANVLVKRLNGVGSMSLLAWMGLFTVPMLFLLSLAFEPVWPSLSDIPATAALSLFYTAACSTVIAYGLWYYLLSRYTVSQVAPFSLLTPVFGIGCGQMFFAEALSAQVLIGGAVTIAGVAVIVLRRPKVIPLGEAV